MQIISARDRNSCQFHSLARSNYSFVSKSPSVDARPGRARGKERDNQRWKIRFGKFQRIRPGNPSPIRAISEFRASEPNVRGETEKERRDKSFLFPEQKEKKKQKEKSGIIESGKFDFWTLSKGQKNALSLRDFLAF